MTTAKTVPNIVIDSGGSNEFTIYTEVCEKIYSKKLTSITPPQSTANWAAGPKDTKIVDLLRIEIRFAVRGMIDSADENKAQSVFTQGGTVNMTYKSETFAINFEKFSFSNDNKTENDETSIQFTALVGVNI